MREAPQNQIRRLGLVLALMIFAMLGTVSPSSGLFPLKEGPEYSLPEKVAEQIGSLIRKFNPEFKSTISRCPAIEGMENSANCFLPLPCSFSIVQIENGKIRRIGVNFGGTHFINDKRCNNKFFLSQAEAILEILFEIPTPRTTEIARLIAPEHNKQNRCDNNGVSALPEGSGMLNYVDEDQHHGRQMIEAVHFVKIFCWVSKAAEK